MPVQSKSEPVPMRQKLPEISRGPDPAPAVAVPATPARPHPSVVEPLAQWDDTIADRFAYLLWMSCFALMVLLLLGDTVFGLLFK